jgi:iron complex transport system ATP-binding protein
MQNTALSINSLSFSVRGKPLLRGISAQIQQGETWSIIGPNGAGKSTLLKCLMRIHSDWTGDVVLNGRNLSTLSQRELARQIAYVPQAGSGNQSLPFTVAEFVRMGRYAWTGLLGAEHPGDNDAIMDAMQRTNTVLFADRNMDTLSGGERQKVFIAAALAQGSNVLLLDEPTAFLDYRHQAEVATIIRNLNQRHHATILNVTHDVNSAMLTGGQVLAVREGEMVWQGDACDLACEETLNAIFGATFRFLDDPVTGLRLVAPQGEKVSA